MRRMAMILVLCAAGCSTNGRYQLGAPVAVPNYQNVLIVPVLDTKTGKLVIWSQAKDYGKELHPSEAGAGPVSAK